MYEFMMFFGPAAITYMIVQGLSNKTERNGIFSLIRLTGYAFIDALLTVVLLYPFGRVDEITNNVTEPHLIYGVAALVVSGVIAVLMGLIISVIRSRISVKMVYERVEDTDDEE